MDTNGIYDDLTVEEQELLVKLQSKLQEKVNAIVSSKIDDGIEDDTQYNEEFIIGMDGLLKRIFLKK